MSDRALTYECRIEQCVGDAHRTRFRTWCKGKCAHFEYIEISYDRQYLVSVLRAPSFACLNSEHPDQLQDTEGRFPISALRSCKTTHHVTSCRRSLHDAASDRAVDLSMIPAITPPIRSAAASTSRSLTCA